jgi:protein-S-isoprenylcysteine O-methyltransferase Ste14
MLTRYVILILLWISWVPTFIRKATGPREKAVVKDTSARWGMLLVGVGFALAWSKPELEVSAWRIPVAVLFGVIGVATSRLAVRHLDKQWRFDAALNADHKLVQTGPYAVVRHPIYASMLAMLITAGLLMASWPMFFGAILAFILGTEIRVRAEEKLLRSRFGEEFDAYAQRVWAYVPFVR